MNQNEKKTDANEEMQPEYDFSGGVRGKYYANYHSNKIVIESNLVANTTSGAESVGAITRPVSMTQPVLYAYSSSNPKIEVGKVDAVAA